MQTLKILRKLFLYIKGDLKHPKGKKARCKRIHTACYHVYKMCIFIFIFAYKLADPCERIYNKLVKQWLPPRK